MPAIEKHNLHLTADGVEAYGHYFWNVNLLTFDQWSKYLYDRSVLYDDYMTLLRSPPQHLLFKLRIEQHLESKEMVKRAQMIAYNNLEQVNLQPGVTVNKIKSIGILTKSITDCDQALSASDATLGNVLKLFEQFRVHPLQKPAPSIKELSPDNEFSGSGKAERDKVKVG
jgi:hypothetical protein